MDGDISIAGLDKADVLRVLYNAARPQGLGFLHYKAEDMTVEEARKLLDAVDYFDYVNGRAMKVEISGDTLNPRFYDRDNGPGAAAAAIDQLRTSA